MPAADLKCELGKGRHVSCEVSSFGLPAQCYLNFAHARTSSCAFNPATPSAQHHHACVCSAPRKHRRPFHRSPPIPHRTARARQMSESANEIIMLDESPSRRSDRDSPSRTGQDDSKEGAMGEVEKFTKYKPHHGHTHLAVLTLFVGRLKKNV